VAPDPFPTNLVDILSPLYPTRESAQALRERAGLRGSAYLTGDPLTLWTEIVGRARLEGGDELLRLVARASHEHPMRDDLRAALGELRQSGVIGGPVRLAGVNWRPPDPAINLEAVTGKVNTLQPVSFLAAGLLVAKAVALITFPDRPGGEGAGTGFLTEDNLLLTCHHVLPTKDRARAAAVALGYETSLDGKELEPRHVELDPGQGFATSEGEDWTAVRVRQDVSTFGAIAVRALEVTVNDYANIIQHPDAGRKHVALYHNVVVRVDPDRVQYLTDTLGGSSGSPVFVRDWRLGALHRGSVDSPYRYWLFGKPAATNVGVPAAVLRRGLDEARRQRNI
jgi:V8-like Glu-specific endopeptidase